MTKKIALIFDTDKGEHIANITSSVAKNLNYEVLTFDARTHVLKACTGCFNCWVKTPGFCSQKDSHPYLKQIFDSKYIMYISKITFGGFSSNVKAHMERMEPLSHPFFTKRNGEMHHISRYKSKPHFLSVGFDAFSQKAEDTFLELTKRNCINCSINKKTNVTNNTLIYKDSDENLTSWIKPFLEAE